MLVPPLQSRAKLHISAYSSLSVNIDGHSLAQVGQQPSSANTLEPLRQNTGVTSPVGLFFYAPQGATLKREVFFARSNNALYSMQHPHLDACQQPTDLPKVR